MYDTIILEYEGQFGRGRTVDEIVSWVETLPPLPDVTSRALRLVDDPNAAPSELAAVLTRDPVLASTIMRAANSAALGQAETVTSLDQAILIIGMNSLKSMLLACALKRWNKNFGEIERLIWEKSLGTAVAAQVIASHVGKVYQNEARLSGLLHNLGQIVMLTHPEVRKDYPRVFQYIKENEADYATAEREVIGFSYPLVGAMVAHKWQLPLSICNCILRHNDIFDGIETKQDEQIAITKLSVALSFCSGIGWPEGHPLICNAVETMALAVGFKEATLSLDFEVLKRQTRALYATESSAYN